MESRKQIGNLLVDAGIISVKTLERALKIQKGSGKRLGELLREMGIVTDEEVTEALACQLKLRTVKNFADLAFPDDLLDLVPASMAFEKLIFPLKYYDRTLAIATFDPFDNETFTQLARKTGMRIYLVLSTKEDITAAVEKHYRLRERVAIHKQRILLIDDSPVFAKVLSTALTKEGYEVLVTEDGIEGLKLALSHHPDLILCDLFMPRMDGYNFIMAVRNCNEIAKIPVILVTSKASMEEENHALKAGFIDFIGKPILPAKIIARVQSTLAIDGNKHEKEISDAVNADLQPTVFATKAAFRAPLQRREFISKVESKFPRSNQQ
jgi:CheY-like chemotaxis protein